MSGTTPTERFVFDTYAVQAATVFSAEQLPSNIVVVTDDAIVNQVDGSSIPQSGDDYVTVAGPGGVVRGKCIQMAYVIECERTGESH